MCQKIMQLENGLRLQIQEYMQNGEETIDGMNIIDYKKYIEEKSGITLAQFTDALNKHNMIYPRKQNKLPDSVISDKLTQKSREIKKLLIDTLNNSIKNTPFTIGNFRVEFNISYSDTELGKGLLHEEKRFEKLVN